MKFFFASAWKLLLIMLITAACSPLFLHNSAPAQTAKITAAEDLLPGSRVRITMPKYYLHPLACQFLKIESDSIFVRIHTADAVFPLREITKIEYSAGKKKNTLTGALIGGITGGVTAGLGFYTLKKGCSGFNCSGQPGFWGGFFSGAALGAGAGAWIGSYSHTQVWVEVPFNQQSH